MTHAIALTPWKRQGYLDSENGSLTMDGIDLAELAVATGTPHFVYSEKRLRANASAMLNALRNIHRNTTIAYASKALANMSVLRILKAEGLGIEINSGGELHKAIQAGFTGDQIVFNGVAKSQTEIEAAIAAQIKAINVDSLGELDRIIECAGQSPPAANVTLRVVPEIQGGGSAGLETGSTSSKFGMTRNEIMIALKKIRLASDKIDFKGFHVHIGSQVNDLSAYRAEATFLIQFLKEIEDLLPRPIEHLNLGGGFPVSYISVDDKRTAPGHFSKTYSATLNIEDVATALIAPLQERLGPDIELIVEPGRSIVADAGVLLTRVEAMKERQDLNWLYLDAGYNVILDAIFSWYFHMVTANRTDDEKTAHFRVFGPLCDSYDAFFDVTGEAAISRLLDQEPSLGKHRALIEETLLRQPGLKELPEMTSVGDIVAILDVGAYNMETQSQYCGRIQPAVSLIRLDGTLEEIRRAETLNDLMARDE